MHSKLLLVAVFGLASLAVTPTFAAPIYANTLVSSSNVTSFGTGLVTGAQDNGGLWLGSSSDPPTALGTLTVSFGTALGNGAGTDLVVFDVASSSDETFNVEVSSDGSVFTLLGEFSAVNNLVDFGAFSDPVSYVRLTNTSTKESADIDALQGIYAAQVPEPGTFALAALALLGITVSRRRNV